MHVCLRDRLASFVGLIFASPWVHTEYVCAYAFLFHHGKPHLIRQLVRARKRCASYFRESYVGALYYSSLIRRITRSASRLVESWRIMS